MRALIWIIEDTWQATVSQAAAFLPADADITLLHVTDTEPETLVRAARRGLLGRHQPSTSVPEPLQAISEQAAHALLADAHSQPNPWTSLSSPVTATTNTWVRAASDPPRAMSSTTHRATYC
jgi:hypothetical protein